MQPPLSAQGLGPPLLQPVSQGLTFFVSKMDTFLAFANFSCVLAFTFFLYFISLLSSFHLKLK